VISYLKQGNIAQIIRRVLAISDSDYQRAEELLEIARCITISTGNSKLIASLDIAKDELSRTRKICSSTRKTIKMRAKGKTVKIFRNIDNSV
jgi:Ca-activated chloride channel family protein